ncbi:MAG TPA: gluconate 2-dehydrogenase subunit 3 family protein [Acetobacteraceae bacterium]|nr:gluconate 2-dehydrogenase subunit 3 family protein [Acetobacteraceae bacterium]
MTDPSAPRYPGYDVLAKRHTPSWNAITRKVIDHRLAVPREPRFFTPSEWTTADAVCQRIIPQPADRPPVPLAALLDAKLLANVGDGFREGDMPYMREAWRQGLAAIDAESAAQQGRVFAALDTAEQDALLGMMQRGELSGPYWNGMGAQNFFAQRILTDIPGLYYSHPTAWSEMGFGGPASPRGYMRMALGRRDPWEAAEAKPGSEARALRDNRHVV